VSKHWRRTIEGGGGEEEEEEGNLYALLFRYAK
jgi:hypothetical protein